MTDLTNTENNLPTNLEQLTVEIKFYVNQWGQNTIEIGKRLISAKEIVGHGNFGKWLEENFNLSQESARKFMNCAERFGNSTTSWNLKYSQMFELLALPAEETEKFIAEKAAEGTPVEDMTVKELRAEVAEWKEKSEKAKSEVEDLFSQVKQAQKEKSELQKDFGRLQAKFKASEDLTHKYHIERDELQRQLENQKPIEKLPDDYEPLKKERDELQAKISQLEKQLKEKPIEVQVPADYEQNKKQLAEFQTQYNEMQEYALKYAELAQVFENIFPSVTKILYSDCCGKFLADYVKKYKNNFAGTLSRMEELVDAMKELEDRI